MARSTSVATLRHFVLLVLFLAGTPLTCQAQLSSTFYSQTCPNALTTIRSSIRSSISAESRMAASLIRLHFHDCFVQGCDASILLDDTSSITGEQNAAPNKDSARGYTVIAKAKTAVEKICPGVVSCADILSVAARDASVMVGGPSWTVNLGRKDSRTASKSLAEQELPSFKAPLASLISIFDLKGLSERDLVALSGAHTIGQASCRTFQDRIYSNGTDIDAGFASTRRRRCPNTGGDGTLAPLDLVTPNSFDYNYFKNLMQKKGLLESDQILFSGSTQSIVSEFSSKPANFNRDFASAMFKMGNIIDAASSSNGEIRRICSAVN